MKTPKTMHTHPVTPSFNQPTCHCLIIYTKFFSPKLSVCKTTISLFNWRWKRLFQHLFAKCSFRSRKASRQFLCVYTRFVEGFAYWKRQLLQCEASPDFCAMLFFTTIKFIHDFIVSPYCSRSGRSEVTSKVANWSVLNEVISIFCKLHVKRRK